jgi:hypothetical protein
MEATVSIWRVADTQVCEKVRQEDPCYQCQLACLSTLNELVRTSPFNVGDCTATPLDSFYLVSLVHLSPSIPRTLDEGSDICLAEPAPQVVHLDGLLFHILSPDGQTPRRGGWSAMVTVENVLCGRDERVEKRDWLRLRVPW